MLTSDQKNQVANWIVRAYWRALSRPVPLDSVELHEAIEDVEGWLDSNATTADLSITRTESARNAIRAAIATKLGLEAQPVAAMLFAGVVKIRVGTAL